LVAIGQELERIERAQAKVRMVAAHASPGKLPEQDKGDARDKIAKQLGVSGRTYEKARAVVEAATTEPDRFGHLVDEMDRTGKVTGAHRKLLKARDEQRILGLVPVAGNFRTLVIDPAWDYDWLSLAGRAAGGYAKMTLEELGQLDVRAWADESSGCHLYCCVTNNFSYEGHKLVERWGFQHRQVISWIKSPPFGLGSYFRNSTELILFATLGETTTRPAASSIPTHFEAPRGEHSERPEKFYEIVRAASYPPYGEAFQRKDRPDFVNLFREGRPAAEAAE
jgi:N6-adenosine-specific RNA methylase IME4